VYYRYRDNIANDDQMTDRSTKNIRLKVNVQETIRVNRSKPVFNTGNVEMLQYKYSQLSPL